VKKVNWINIWIQDNYQWRDGIQVIELDKFNKFCTTQIARRVKKLNGLDDKISRSEVLEILRGER
jgi:hypothetical protein